MVPVLCDGCAKGQETTVCWQM